MRVNILIVLCCCFIVKVISVHPPRINDPGYCPLRGPPVDDHGCNRTLGYRWCEIVESCVRDQRKTGNNSYLNIECDQRGSEYCTSDEDFNRMCSFEFHREYNYTEDSRYPTHSYAGANYGSCDPRSINPYPYWCSRERRCVGLPRGYNENNALVELSHYCMPVMACAFDDHVCAISLGQRWCSKESRCVSLWGMAEHLQLLPSQVLRYCSERK